jgi:hypothetical protein
LRWNSNGELSKASVGFTRSLEADGYKIEFSEGTGCTELSFENGKTYIETGTKESVKNLTFNNKQIFISSRARKNR